MGTNATRKAASKIVAILLAALMLISVMPMTAFAADDKLVIDGMSLVANSEKWEDEEVYFEGDTADLTGLAIEITYRKQADIDKYGERAIYYADIVTFENYDQWTKALSLYGVDCNVSELDDTTPDKKQKKLTVEDNFTDVIFSYGKKGEKTFNIGQQFIVLPLGWTSAEKIGNIVPEVEYVLVANDSYVISGVELGTLDLKGDLGDNALALIDVNVDEKNDRITNLTEQLDKLDLELSDVQWITGSATHVDDEGTYVINWLNDGKYMSAAEAEDSNYKDSYPLIKGAMDKNKEPFNSTKWFMDYDENSYLYVVEYVDSKDADDAYADVIGQDGNVNWYVAVNTEDGYAYLTTDKKEAASISAYAINGEFEVESIEIVEDADKLSYSVGEEFDPAGIKVNLTLSDGSVLCIPEKYFELFGIHAGYDWWCDCDECEYDYKLTVAANDQPYVVWFDDEDYENDFEGIKLYGYAQDYSNTKLSVAALGNFQAEIPDGELKDGYYAIVWSETEDFVKNNIYTGIALDADNIQTIKRNDYDVTDYSFGKLGATSYVQIRNNTIGKFEIYNIDDHFVEQLEKSMIWFVKAAGNNSYTIQLAGTDLYLNRATLTYRDLWSVEEIAKLSNNVASVDAREYIADNKLVALGAYDEAVSLWKIDGTCDASIESAGVKGKGDNEYLIVSGDEENEVAPAASNDRNEEKIFITSAKDDVKGDNFYFFACESIVPAKIEVIHQPALKYNSGDKLDLRDMIVRITYNNGLTPVEVAYADFNSYGITANVEDGKVLVGSDNGTTITVSLGKLTASTDKLAVADSTAAVEDVRLGGADRYATAALIAENTITVLADAYTGNVVLASGEDYPDALAGAGLASAANAPIVLTKAAALPAATVDFLKNNNVKTVYIIGGTAAVSEDVAKAVEAMGIKVERISGSNRVETSVNVAKKAAELSAKTSDTIIITTGNGYADALSVSSAAAIKNIPVVYASGALSDSVKALLTDDVKTVIILGGTNAVSDDVKAEVEAMGKAVVRLSGSTRYDTGVAINKYFADAFEGKVITIATGAAFADALAGSAYAAAVKAPVVLVDSEYSNTNVRDYVLASDFTNLVVFGGTAAVPAETVDAILGK